MSTATFGECVKQRPIALTSLRCDARPAKIVEDILEGDAVNIPKVSHPCLEDARVDCVGADDVAEFVRA